MGKIRNHALSIWIFLAMCMLLTSGLKGLANYASAILMVLLVLLGVMKNRGLCIKKEALCIVIFIAYYVLTSIPELNPGYCLKYAVDYCLCFFPIVMFRQLENKCSMKQMRLTLRGMYVIWFAISLISIQFYISNPNAARNAAADGDYYSGRIFGGYEFSYGSALLCNYLFYLLMKTRSKKMPLIAGCGVLLLLVYLTQSTLTTFAALTGMLVTLVFEGREGGMYRYRKRFISFFAVLIVLFVLYLYLESNVSYIISWLYRYDDIRILKRIREILNSVFFDVQTRHYAERTGLVRDSLQLFLKSPIFGHGYRYGNVFSAGKIYGIGNHSEFLDSLARFGLVGSIPLFGIYYYSLRKYILDYLGILVCFGVLVMFNPFISFQSNLVIFMLVPLSEAYRKAVNDMKKVPDQ